MPYEIYILIDYFMFKVSYFPLTSGSCPYSSESTANKEQYLKETSFLTKDKPIFLKGESLITNIYYPDVVSVRVNIKYFAQTGLLK